MFDKSKYMSTNELIERPFNACGESTTVHFRRLPALDLRRYYAELTSGDPEVRAKAGFSALAKSIRDPDGKACVTADELGKFKAEAIKVLTDLFSEIHAQQEDGDLGNA